MLKENEGQEQNCVGLTVQREARCTNDLLGFSDKELLTLAAKAANYNLTWGAFEIPEIEGLCPPDGGSGYVYWCPRDDDGDALRLASDLQMMISNNGEFAWAVYGEKGYVKLKLEGDKMQVVRRVILLAAAQIGRART